MCKGMIKVFNFLFQYTTRRLLEKRIVELCQRKEISGSFITFNIFIATDNIFHVNPVGADFQSLQKTQIQDNIQNIFSLS